MKQRRLHHTGLVKSAERRILELEEEVARLRLEVGRLRGELSAARQPYIPPLPAPSPWPPQPYRPRPSIPVYEMPTPGRVRC